jgi:3',5'-cyclic AMP phosphodiesterase CpdA
MPRYILLIVLLATICSSSAEVLIYGDTRSHPEIHRLLIAQVKERDFDLVLHLGDLNQKGRKQAEYDEFLGIISPLKAEFFPIRGNHEKDLQLFLKNFPQIGAKSYYTICRDSIQYTILDSNLSLLPDSEQYRWLQHELQQSALPVILLLHHPVFSSGYHGQELNLQLYLPELLRKYNVIAVISGHEHSFEHLCQEGLPYIVSGGGGAPLRGARSMSPYSKFFCQIHHYNILQRKTDYIQFETYDLKGNLIYEFQIPLTQGSDE